MRLSAAPYTRASWPFGKGAMVAWARQPVRRRSTGVKAVSIPIEDATPRHDPVMVEEILRDFELDPGDTVFDGTLGLGGHSLAFVDRIMPGGCLLATDWDESMLNEAKSRLALVSGDIRLIKADFRELPDIAQKKGLLADAILLDLGLNSAQVDDPSRGFSFRAEGPLDMRMDRSKGEPASALLNRMTPAQLESAIKDLGDERWARAIAKQIVERRKQKPLKTTEDLVDCVLAAIPPGAREKRIHPATRTMQAVRILTNGEFEALHEALTGLASCLKPGGTLAVLSYHSGEDRIVKRTFRELAENGYLELHKKPVEATEGEVRRNPRSRSAKLRSLRRQESISQPLG